MVQIFFGRSGLGRSGLGRSGLGGNGFGPLNRDPLGRAPLDSTRLPTPSSILGWGGATLVLLGIGALVFPRLVALLVAALCFISGAALLAMAVQSKRLERQMRRRERFEEPFEVPFEGPFES